MLLFLIFSWLKCYPGFEVVSKDFFGGFSSGRLYTYQNMLYGLPYYRIHGVINCKYITLIQTHTLYLILYTHIDLYNL